MAERSGEWPALAPAALSHAFLLYFFNDTDDEVPWILQNNYVGKMALDSVMIFASREYVLEMQEKQIRDKLMLIFSVWDSLKGHKGD